MEQLEEWNPIAIGILEVVTRYDIWIYIYGYIWIYMDIYGYIWIYIYMDIYIYVHMVKIVKHMDGMIKFHPSKSHPAPPQASMAPAEADGQRRVMFWETSFLDLRRGLKLQKWK